ncbi:polyphosphate kinase 2 [Raineyella sp. LH-20]|uniref:polyphosphate kinase 2 n=1 Tax=Raineyella sp. LH-20 TaxID=3081204 RepID=UPI002954E665|nr:polyphosphate kinase 2 [Raineyella sp. LH-20]WOP17584.1 polyphosphate kinase 2 [Raineyella sp. LH-20]
MTEATSEHRKFGAGALGSKAGSWTSENGHVKTTHGHDRSDRGRSDNAEAGTGHDADGHGVSGDGKSSGGEKSGNGKSGNGKSGNGKSGNGKSGNGKSGNGKSGNGNGKNGKHKVMDRKIYESELLRLQAELVEMQEWVKTTGQRMVVIFEGRDAAGKGGAIKRVSEYLNPRLTEIVALPAPTERQRTQWYFQRYIEHLPAAGEIKLFDRSWYNRGGVERVMGYCTPDEYVRFLRQCPIFERMLVEDGIILRKYWFSVSAEEQYRRFESRLTDPMRRWKLSPTDIESLTKWEDYSRAKDEMFVHTDLPESRWHVVESEDKRAARINMIAHLLASVPYEHVEHPKLTLPKRPESTGYRRTDRELQHEVPDYAASLTDENVPSPYEDPEDFAR